MKTVLLITALLCAVAIAAAAVAAPKQPPSISEDYTAVVVASEYPVGGRETVNIWSDSVEGRYLTASNETVGPFRLPVFQLHIDGDDADATYEYAPALSQCTAVAVNGSLPSLFGWLPAASFEGQTIVNERLTDIWLLNLKGGAFVLTLYVDSAATGVPVRFTQWQSSSKSNSTLIFDFVEFDASRPDAARFDVPVYCPQPAASSKRSATRSTLVNKFHNGLAQAQSLIHWKCDACKAACEVVISVACSGGASLCGPFEPACEALCEDGCYAADCSEWACKKVGFC
jgi:hypothetical protein